MNSSQVNLDTLFSNFVETMDHYLHYFEQTFDISGARESFLGTTDELNNEDEDLDNYAQAFELALNSHPWKTLERVYQYGVDGKISPDGTPAQIVSEAGLVISYLKPSAEILSPLWPQILQLSQGRLALDNGSPVSPQSVALLAGVDIRTVRNACSAGEVINFKTPLTGELMIDNASARAWLSGRRGFKATNKTDARSLGIPDIHTPSEFGAMIKSRLSDLKRKDVFNSQPASDIWDDEALKALEEGNFNAPISAVEALSTHLKLDRKELLLCVMRVFYREELDLLENR